MTLKNTTPTENPLQNFPITAIAGAVGELEALLTIISQLPKDSGIAYVVIQHLSSDNPPNLADELAKSAQIPVVDIVSEIDFKPDHIYIVPQNNYLKAEDGILKMHVIKRIDKITQNIDISFEAIAQVYKSFAIGVVLSGTAFDGTFGLKKIKEYGGVTIVQDPETSDFKTKSQNAIEADVVDFILAPENVAPQLAAIRKSYLDNYAYSDEEHIPKKEEDILNQILNLILQKTENDFFHYKRPAIRRRITRRMVILKKETMSDYYTILRSDKNEQELLFNDLLIPVTYFFRDEDSFQTLSKTILPQLIQNCTNNTLRLWSAACSTGEEAYSLAIVICEYFTLHNIKDLKVQIFASDISEKSIAKARSAIYSAQDIQHISEIRVEKYFTKRDGQYHVNKIVRDMCIFATHNFIKDPPFAKIDLVSCRNVLIYLNSFLQEKVLSSFHYSLKEKGFLFLGKSESANNTQHLFEAVVKQDKIYAKKFTPARYVPQAFKPVYSTLSHKIKTYESTTQETDFRKIADDILFSKYTPASVIINEHLEIVHFHGDTSPFLLPAPGRPNFNILKMAREGISFELRNSISEITKNKETIIRENLSVKGQNYQASFEILALSNDEDHLMILFHKTPLPETDLQSKNNKKNADKLRIAELEKELSHLREDIKRVTEEEQIAFEELQTTNEELLSSTEELQAMNEELQTSTEELQSNNQELMCTNDELLDRQEQLLSLRNYAESIVQTIREPLIVIDKDFNVKSANPSFYKYFNFTEKDIEGFSFFEIGNCQWDIPDFKELLFKMVIQKQTIEDYKLQIICGGDRKTLVANARLIQNTKPEGMILLAFEDITDILASNELLNKRNAELQIYNEQLENFTSAASHDLQEPLNKIHMLSQRVFEKEKSLSESGKHNLQRTMHSAKNMSQLIADLINYSRLNFSEKKFKKTDLNLLIKKMLTDIKDSIDEKKAVVDLDIKENSVNAISFQIQQLLTNLILNSIKYSKQDIAPEIRIETMKAPIEEIKNLGGNPENKYIKINVIDNGIGFSKDFEERIFEPFYRLHSKDEYAGSGLGLTLVKKIVSNHNGFIKASSTIGFGTTISIYLPV
nr:CheR family methyltransferase [uncultured Flavobacterium sp.]